MKEHTIGLIIAITIVVIAIPFLAWQTSRELADVRGQGGEGPNLANNGVELKRNNDGLSISLRVPTPEPGSYEYPTGDMVPEGASHPDVVMGVPGDSEVFTFWAFVFNHPEECTDDTCDFDDIGDTPAKGGVFQVGARIGEDRSLAFESGVRLGQTAFNGSPLENPIGAEVHVGIAPHGKALTGDDLWAQLNGPIGNVTLWWAATFETS